jgi:aspartyl-tRNA(Asn)/glutamyl-tRNA(Gln) amidotransferase subunit C
MSEISKETVEQIAQLARLELSEVEEKKFQGELSNILGYVDTIQKADVKDVEPTANVTGLKNVLREDEKIPSKLSRDEILSNAPDKKDGYIKVKSVLGNGE